MQTTTRNNALTPPRRPATRPARPLLLLMLPMLLVGCESFVNETSRVAVADVSQACKAWHYVSWHPSDTLETVKSVRSNNARRYAFCKKK